MVAHFCMNDCSRDFISLYVCGSFIRSNWKFQECAQNHKISAVENRKKKSLPSTLGKTFTFEECNGYAPYFQGTMLKGIICVSSWALFLP